MALYMVKYDLQRPLQNADDKVFVSRLSSDSAWCGLEEKGSDWLKKHM